MAFVTTWTTTGADETITIPCGNAGTYNATIDWGDGSPNSTITTYNDADLTHTYAVADTYTISITGTLPMVFFNNGGDKLKIKSIEEWGSVGVVSGNRAYYGCVNLVSNATDTPDMSSVTNMQRMFQACAAFNQDIGGWNTGAVTDMSSMFQGCTSFNQDIGGWDVSSVTNMAFMFFACTSFNPDISGWDVSSLENMAGLFHSCSSFNQDVGGWDVSSVTNMSSAFQNCTAFDQDLSSWDVSSVTSMANMLSGVTLSIINYDRLLIGWEGQAVQDNVNFHGGNSVYCYGASARAALVADHTWTITDGGEDAGPCINPFLPQNHCCCC